MGPFRQFLSLVTAGVFVVALGPALCVAVEAAEREGPGHRDDSAAVVDFDIGPRLFPPRRGLTPSKALMNSVELAIEQCVEADMAAIDAPGAAVTVIHRGDVIFNRGFGVKRQGGSEAVGTGTRFRIGSATKMFTAAAVMQQVEAGLVDLDDPVTVWIPELTLRGQWTADSITVRHLLTHTSAFPDYYYAAIPGPSGDHALGDWAGSLANVRLHAPPGSFWNYSNPGFALAGLVAERASGLPYRSLVSDRVFAAAGMSATTFDPMEVVASGDYSHGHHREDGEETVYAPDDYDSWYATPAGLAFSTAQDLAQWALMLLDGGAGVVSPASAAAMQARQIYLEYFPDYHYGLGIFAETYKGLDVRQHGGNLYGWGAMLLWVPEERFVVSILDNTTYHLTAAAYCIVDAVLQPESPDPPDLSTPISTWAQYVGTYEFMDNRGDFFEATVRLHGEHFFVTFFSNDEPGSFYQTDLVQRYLDTFRIDLDGDGALDFDLTFVRPTALGSQRMWLRNRSFVGLRAPPLRHAGGRHGPD